MSDAEVALLLRLIRTLLNKGIDSLENDLSGSQFAIQTGKPDNLLNPLRTDYPVLYDLYSLRDVLSDGVDDLLKKKS